MSEACKSTIWVRLQMSPMDKRHSRDKKLGTAHKFLACVIAEQRAATDELEASTKELEAFVEDILASRSELRTALDEAKVEEASDDVPPSDTPKSPGTGRTTAQLKREADEVLKRGHQAVKHSTAVRKR